MIIVLQGALNVGGRHGFRHDGQPAQIGPWALIVAFPLAIALAFAHIRDSNDRLRGAAMNLSEGSRR